MGEKRKVLLLDGHSLAYRAFFALPATMSTTGGQPTNAVFGFTSMLLKVLDEERPDAVVVAFDGPRADLHRAREFPDYKAHRPAMPDELRSQMDLIEHLLGHMKIPTVRAEGYEADDVLGTMAKKVSGQGQEAVIVTGDRDTLQLVDEGVRVLMTGKGITETVSYDREVVEEKYGLPPERLPDMAGLKGDASDNIPGVPGIGEKGACALIGQYGTLEALYENIDGISGEKRRSSLEDNRDIAFLSRDLARLKTDLSLGLDVDDVEFGLWDRHEVLDYLSALEFKTLALRFLELFGEGLSAEEGSHGGEVRYELVDNSDSRALESFLEEAREAGAVGLASALSGTGYCELELVSLAVATSGSVMAVSSEDGEGAWHTAHEILASPEIEKWLHDAKGTLEGLDRRGLETRAVSFDTVLAAYLENPSLGTYYLWDIWERNLGGRISIQGMPLETEPADQPSLLEEGGGARDLGVAADAARVYHLKPVLEEKLHSAGMRPLYTRIEMPLMEVLKEMEETGVALDGEVLRVLSDEAAAAIEGLKDDIYRLAGREFNVGSPKQLAQVLFEDMSIIPSKKTKTGYSTDSSVLEALKEDYPIAGRILEFREYSKLKSTYFDVLPALVCPATGRVHGSFNQTATATGRISSSNPNLQNIPVRTDIGRRIRAAFVPGEPGWRMVVADYSQIELRVLAHMSADERLLDSFARDADIHSETAAEIFGVPPGEVSAEMRRMAKVVNFGVVYGMGYYGLSSRLGITMEDATRYIDTYFETYEGVRKYRDKCIADATRLGYAETLFGRRRFIPELTGGSRQTRELGERIAINTPLQGTAADIIKKAMVEASAALGTRGMKARLTLQIHDELMFEAPPGELEELTGMVRECMMGAADLLVPLSVDIGVFDNWGEAKQ
jgi:DNA polymerase I